MVIDCEFSFNDIESGIVWLVWDELCIYYIFNCVVLGCFNLGKEVYWGVVIEQQMEEVVIVYVNYLCGVVFDKDGELILLKIYVWYREDYGDGKEGVLCYIEKYLLVDMVVLVCGCGKVDSYVYDWNLNDMVMVEQVLKVYLLMVKCVFFVLSVFLSFFVFSFLVGSGSGFYVLFCLFFIG